MGNRAVVMFEDNVHTNDKYVGVYLHWNGGPDSVYAYLDYMKTKGIGSGDNPYTRARFVQIVSNFFGGTTSIGVDAYYLKEACNVGDNGLYVVQWRGNSYTVDRYVGNVEKLPASVVEAEEIKAKSSPYWTNTPNILDDISKKNDMHFSDALYT